MGAGWAQSAAGRPASQGLAAGHRARRTRYQTGVPNGLTDRNPVLGGAAERSVLDL